MAGCASYPSVSKQAELLAHANLALDVRYAVVERDWDSAHKSDPATLGGRLSDEIANVLTEELGINAIALDHSAGSAWSAEMQRARKEVGWFAGFSYAPFFRTSGYDGYAMLVLIHAEDWEKWEESPALVHYVRTIFILQAFGREGGEEKTLARITTPYIVCSVAILPGRSQAFEYAIAKVHEECPRTIANSVRKQLRHIRLLGLQ